MTKIQKLLLEDEANKKKFTINFRVSEQQKKEIEEFIEYYGMKKSTWFDLMIKNTKNGMILDKDS